MARQTLESQNPKLQHERDIPKELLSYYRVAVSRTKERFAQACRDNDVAFLQRLYKAAKLIAKGVRSWGSVRVRSWRSWGSVRAYMQFAFKAPDCTRPLGAESTHRAT